jgi:hypothetical protein
MKHKETLQIAILLSAIICLVAILRMPYGFYSIVRMYTFLTYSYLSFHFFEAKNNKYFFPSLLILIIYNPMLKVFLKKETWTIVNIISALFSLYLYYLLKNNKNIFGVKNGTNTDKPTMV